MKAVMVMYDSLNRHLLPNYGCDWTLAPNFVRLGERAVTFDNHYVGSMPCMPARRELHTGRHNFLHRSWGPFEPFDDSTFTILKDNGVYTHLVSDHYHYWEDGGATYHHRYSSWENMRGQEGDAWKGEVADPDIPEHLGRIARQDWVNRKYMQEEHLTPQARTFAAGLEFLETNRDQDNWYLQIETFDPHEPFFTLKQWKDRYNYEWDGPHFDWPKYERVSEDPDAVEYLRY
ncbi:MAG: sulfatase-like hydrolase/transferase, partial [Pseudomonadales bacterium]|nr:sulfatase-like hydrolase/transferase [Pseudomonadales bacterium]